MKNKTIKFLTILIFVVLNSCQSQQKDITEQIEFPKQSKTIQSDENSEYIELEHLNTNSMIVVNTPSYNRFKKDSRISDSFQLRSDLIDNDKVNQRLDSISYQLNSDTLIITHIYFTVGSCMDFIATYESDEKSIRFYTPDEVYITPEEYSKDSLGIESVDCSLANFVQVTTSFIMIQGDELKEIHYNGKRLK